MKLRFQLITSTNSPSVIEVYTVNDNMFKAGLRKDFISEKWVLYRNNMFLTAKELKQIYKYLKELNND